MVLKNYIEKYNDGGKANERERRKQAYDFFIEKGYKPEHALGIIGNLMVESHSYLDTQARGDNDTAYGIAQWRLDRLTNLKKVRPKDWKTLNGQLEFIDWELKNKEKTAYSKLLATSTPTEAALAFSASYERPHEDYHHNDRRIKNAQLLGREVGYFGGAANNRNSAPYERTAGRAAVDNTQVKTRREPLYSGISNNQPEYDHETAVDNAMKEQEYFRYDTPQDTTQENQNVHMEALDNLKTLASTQEESQRVNESLEQYKSLIGFDPYNYINLETFQKGGTYLPKYQAGRDRLKIKDERLDSLTKRNTIVPVQKKPIEDRGVPEEFKTPKIFLDEVVVKVSKEGLRREKKLEEAQDIKTEGVDKRLTQGIETPKDRESTLEAQKFLKGKGYDLNPKGTFKNEGVDGILGKVTKGAIESYNKSVTGSSPYEPIKEGKGKLGECTEKQCSEYVQNEVFRNVSPDMTRAEWNKKTGLHGNAWEMGKNIVDKGGEEISTNLVREGDVVTIYTGGYSEYQKQADKAGVGTTHTAVVDKVNPDGTYEILHNVHKKNPLGDFVGQEYRDKVDATGKVAGWNYFEVKKAYRPNYENVPRDKVKVNPNIKITKRPDSYTVEEASSFIPAINDSKNKNKFINYYNIDEEEFYSISKAAMGVLGQETNYGTSFLYDKGVKRLGASLQKLAGQKSDEISRGAGSMKLDTNLPSEERSIFGITKNNIDQPEKAVLATMQKLTNSYKQYLKKGYSKKDAMYRAIARYNGSLIAKTAGKTKEQWAKEYDLDYVNKVINFASDFDIEEEGSLRKTFIDELALEDNVLKWQGYVENQK